MDLETLEFDAERDSIRAAVSRLQRMEKQPGEAVRMVREAFETVGAALGHRPLSVRMLQHAECIGRELKPMNATDETQLREAVALEHRHHP